MAIKAQRFDAMDFDSNVGTASFGKDADSSVMNSPINALKEKSTTLNDLISTGSESAAKASTSAREYLDSLESSSRFTKDIKSSFTDLSSLPAKYSSEFFSEISLGNAGMAKSLSGMAKRCSAGGNGMGAGVPGKPWDMSMNCGGGNVSLGKGGGSSGSGCNASSFGNMLNSLTGGSYASSFKDLNSMLRSLMSLAGFGYNLGMCGVFSALGKGLPNDVLSRASGSLLDTMGSSSNTNGFLDLASSAVGLTPLLDNPSAIGNFFSHFKQPSNTTDSQLSDLADRVMGGSELLDDSWNQVDTTGFAGLTFPSGPSVSEVGMCTPDLRRVFGAKLTNRSFGSDELDLIPSMDEDFFLGGAMMA